MISSNDLCIDLCIEPLEQGLPQAGLIRCAAFEKVSFSPFDPMVECYSGGMLSHSLQTLKGFPLFVS